MINDTTGCQPCSNCGHVDAHTRPSPVGPSCSHETDEDRWVEGANGVGGWVGAPWQCGCNEYEPEEPEAEPTSSKSLAFEIAKGLNTGH